MLNCGQIFVFMKILASNILVLLFALSVPLVLKLSEVTWNHWLSLDDAYSHKWCHNETCLFMFNLQGICITLSRDKSLTSDHEIRFRSI